MDVEPSCLEEDVPLGTARIKKLLTDPLGVRRSFFEVPRCLDAQKAAFANWALTAPAPCRDKFIFGIVRPLAAGAKRRIRS